MSFSLLLAKRWAAVPFVVIAMSVVILPSPGAAPETKRTTQVLPVAARPEYMRMVADATTSVGREPELLKLAADARAAADRVQANPEDAAAIAAAEKANAAHELALITRHKARIPVASSLIDARISELQGRSSMGSQKPVMLAPESGEVKPAIPTRTVPIPPAGPTPSK